MMINVFGEEEFRPVTKFGVVIPDYFVSRDGRVLSSKTSKPKILNPKYEIIEGNPNAPGGGYKVPHSIGLRVRKDMFPDYTYNTSQQNLNVPGSKYYKRLTKDPTKTTIYLKYHRAVMEAWKPIDEYPPERLKDCWEDIPEEAKQWIRESAIIDHIDGDTFNNHVDNLRWVTPKENSHHRKAQIGLDT